MHSGGEEKENTLSHTRVIRLGEMLKWKQDVTELACSWCFDNVSKNHLFFLNILSLAELLCSGSQLCFFGGFFTQIWHWTSSGDLTWIIYQYFQALQILKPVWKEIHPIIDVPASMTSLSFRHSHDMNWIRKLIWILHLKLIRKLNNEITIM